MVGMCRVRLMVCGSPAGISWYENAGGDGSLWIERAVDERIYLVGGAFDVALVLHADHELNASSFAARVAVSAGASLPAAVLAAAATLSGFRHGGTCDRIEALVAETGRPERAAAVVAERLAEGRPLWGFGHTLYPDGDPRAPALLDIALELRPTAPRLRVLRALVGAVRAAGREPPTLDAGLVAVSAALGLPPGTATALFALGRSAGWIAHALEQRDSGALIRPRARYVGPPA